MNGRIALIIGIAALAAILLAFGPAPDAKDGGNTLHVVTMTGPDSIDPGVSWMSTSWQMQVNVYNGLLTFKKETGPGGTELVPDLATSLPVISDGGRTLTFHVRKGVMFGPPANREVKPSDIKYTFDRLALLPSQGAGFFQVLQGFDKVYNSHKGSVSGVVADDAAGTIVFHLKRPDATFLYVLALPFSYAVPKGTPAKDLSQGNRAPATGPYQFTEYDPARIVKLERNPAFKQWTKDTPNGKVDSIEVKIGVSDENAITLIMQGKADAAMTAIPRSRLPFLKSSEEWTPYMHEHELARTSYIWMNSQLPPFNNVKVRQAVNWAINRRAMVKLGGGSSSPSSTILPPTMPGYTGYEPYPKQDLAKAKQLIEESGVKVGSVEVTIWCMTTPPNPDSAQYLQEILTQLGFDARTRCVDGSAYYNLIGAQSNKTQIGFASWGADFPEGATFIDSNLNGSHINPDHSSNYAWYSGMDSEIDRVMQMIDLDQRAKAWGALDRKLIEQEAVWAPLGHGVQRNLMSKRLGEYYFHPLYDFLFMRATVDGSGTNNSKMHDFEVGYEQETVEDVKDGDAS